MIEWSDMAYNKELTDKIRRKLAHIARVEEKRMFRGMTFMVDDKMCISVGDDRIMCRIDPAIHDEVIKKEGCSTVEMRGRPYKGFVYVNPQGMKTERDLDYWISLALEFNKKAKAAPKRKKK